MNELKQEIKNRLLEKLDHSMEMEDEAVQELVENGGDLPEETLKELLGHTPLQVFVGGVLGLIIAIIAAR